MHQGKTLLGVKRDSCIVMMPISTVMLFVDVMTHAMRNRMLQLYCRVRGSSLSRSGNIASNARGGAGEGLAERATPDKIATQTQVKQRRMADRDVSVAAARLDEHMMQSLMIKHVGRVAAAYTQSCGGRGGRAASGVQRAAMKRPQLSTRTDVLLVSRHARSMLGRGAHTAGSRLLAARVH